MVFVTRVERFSAAHKLFNSNWSSEQNDAVFGKCANNNWHGHNFELHVTVKGKPNVDTGFVYDAKKLGVIIRTHIVEQLDYKNINMDVPFMAGQLTSIENLIIAIWKELEQVLPSEVKLHKLKLIETPHIYAEYYGD